MNVDFSWITENMISHKFFKRIGGIFGDMHFTPLAPEESLGCW